MGKYTSTPTRFFSFDQFLGEAKINESVPERCRLPWDGNQDLRAKFHSNLPIRQMPTAYGLKMQYRPIRGKKIV